MWGGQPVLAALSCFNPSAHERAPSPGARTGGAAGSDSYLPGPPWVADIADRVQCPPDFVAVGVMVAAAAVIGRQIAIRPKRQDDWAVVPNLWGLAVGPPGVMKSPALAEALRPLHRLVTDAHAQDEEQRLAQHFHRAEQQARRHALAQRLRAAVAHEASTEDLREPFAAVSRDTPR